MARLTNKDWLMCRMGSTSDGMSANINNHNIIKEVVCEEKRDKRRTNIFIKNNIIIEIRGTNMNDIDILHKHLRA